MLEHAKSTSSMVLTSQNDQERHTNWTSTTIELDQRRPMCFPLDWEGTHGTGRPRASSCWHEAGDSWE